MSLKIEEILKETGCIRRGHFEWRTSRHSGYYCDFRLLSQMPDAMRDVCKYLSNKMSFEIENPKIEVVVGSKDGSLVPVYEMAQHLGVESKFLKEIDNKMFCEDKSTIEGKNVLVVDDAVYTGTTIKKIIAGVEKAGGNVIGVAVIVNRSKGILDFSGIKFVSGISFNYPMYEKDRCPLCKDKQAIEVL